MRLVIVIKMMTMMMIMDVQKHDNLNERTEPCQSLVPGHPRRIWGKNQQNLPLFHLTILTLTSISLETKPDRLQPHAMQVQVLSKQFHSWLCRSLTFILVEVILLFSSWEQICIKHFQVLDITDCLLWGSLQVVASGWRALILRVEVPANTLQIKQNTLHWGVSWCHYFRKKWSVGFFCYFDIFLQTCISLYCCSIAMLSW